MVVFSNLVKEVLSLRPCPGKFWQLGRASLCSSCSIPFLGDRTGASSSLDWMQEFTCTLVLSELFNWITNKQGG